MAYTLRLMVNGAPSPKCLPKIRSTCRPQSARSINMKDGDNLLF